MKKCGLCLTLITILFFFNRSAAQTYIKGREFKKADVNFAELAKYYEAHPLPVVKKMPFDEDEDRPENPPADPSEVHLLDRSAAGAKAAVHAYSVAMLPVSPAPNDSFLSTPSPISAIPPDTHGAVDSAYCVTAINTNVHIQSRTGFNIYNVGIDGFWSALLSHGSGSFDPRVHYDPFYKRWIMVADAYGETGYSQIMIGVSATSDPTGTWHLYSVLTDPTGAAWLDFPNVGFNSKWIVVTGNMFPNTSGGASGAVIYVFDYASIMAGTGAPYTLISKPTSFSICPAVTYDPAQSSVFAVESYNSGSGQVRLWKISGPVGSPAISSIGFPTSATHWHGGQPSGADFARQSGTTGKVDIGDDRFTSLMYRNNKLWCSHTVFLPSGGTATRSSIQWWQIDTLAIPLQIGYIDDPATPSFFGYSSIAVNRNDDALIGFACLNSTIHPSAGYALRMHTDPLDSVRPVSIFRHGTGTYYTTFGGGQNRWGDYSATCVDPRNDDDFWTIQEVSNSGSSVNWETWWANVQFCPKPAEPTMAVTPVSPCIGDTATYAINPIAGATSYTWYVTGTGWSGSGTSTSINLTAGTGIATILVLAYNSCGEGETHFFNITPATPPYSPAITTIVPACVGSPTAVFSATSSGAVGYSWIAYGSGWSGADTATSLTANLGTGTGTIVCTTTNRCGSSSDTILVTPAVTPVTTFSEWSHEIMAATTDTITFTGSAPAGSAYSWNFGGGTGVPGIGPGPQVVTWTVPGTKTVTLTVDNGGCSSAYSDTVRVDRDNTGIVEIAGRNLVMMPNPNDGTFYVVFNQPQTKQVTIKLVDVQGRVVYNRQYSQPGSKLAVVASHLPAGAYTINIMLDGTTISKKISITR
jgi:hypothetical protein